ncbi:hypothetical protein STCU_10575 [Strigomonas culicis]|uniref:Uncharacterized protein n=1 Tax=Strigomonas culicis TaxID=28005 RepID=S9THJ3_9TRYP|nr:hypothetical protein STCU_10575 [Strigomonas culicis]|eukprot:EPY17512.1 hypothetical protein STCU_10575 [Strigomonas culicis]
MGSCGRTSGRGGVGSLSGMYTGEVGRVGGCCSNISERSFVACDTRLGVAVVQLCGGRASRRAHPLFALDMRAGDTAAPMVRLGISKRSY